MMNEWVHNFMPSISPVMIITLDIIIGIAFISGACYRTPSFARGNEGAWGFIQVMAVSLVTVIVFINEHYDGLVQLIINYLQHNHDTSAAWADIIAIIIIAVFGTCVGAAYLSIKKFAYARFNHKIYSRN